MEAKMKNTYCKKEKIKIQRLGSKEIYYTKMKKITHKLLAINQRMDEVMLLLEE